MQSNINVEIIDIGANDILVTGNTYPIKNEIQATKLFVFRNIGGVKGWKTSKNNLDAVLRFFQSLPNVNVVNKATAAIVAPAPYQQPTSPQSSSGKDQNIYVDKYDDNNIIVKGNTYRIKEKLKEAKLFRWNNIEKGWMTDINNYDKVITLLNNNNVVYVDNTNMLGDLIAAGDNYLFSVNNNIQFGDLVMEDEWEIPQGNSTVVVAVQVDWSQVPENINTIFIAAYKRKFHVNADAKVFMTRQEALNYLYDEYKNDTDFDLAQVIPNTNNLDEYIRLEGANSPNIVQDRAFVIRAINID